MVLMGPGGIGTTRALPTPGLNSFLNYYSGNGPSRPKLEKFIRNHLVFDAADVPDSVIRPSGPNALRTPWKMDLPGGALVVDLSAMKAIGVYPEMRVVRAQPGVLLGELDAAAQERGLAVPAGTVNSTGVAGLTLGGGIGHLMRRFGATVDNLLACEMVTVDGRKVRADEAENPELFWALRGGGGNLGVVTAFEYRAHSLGPDVVAGQLIFPFEQAAEVLAKLPAHMATAPRELGLLAAIAPAPALPMLPPEAHGRPVLVLVPVFTGDPATAASALKRGQGRTAAREALRTRPGHHALGRPASGRDARRGHAPAAEDVQPPRDPA